MVERELAIKKAKNLAAWSDTMFNFHQSRLLKIFTSWSQVENAWLRRMVRGLGGPMDILNPLLRKKDDSEAMRQLKKSPML